MSAPADRDQYSTLEVASDADVLRQGKYPEVVPPSIPEAYGYYGPPKTEQNAQLLSGATPQQTQQIPATPQTYSTYPEVATDGANQRGAASAGDSKGATICGLRRRYFWIALVVAILVIIGVIVGAVVGSMKRNAGSSSDDNPENVNNGTDPAKLTLYENTRLASANFTDTYGNDNFLLVYQLSDASISLSAFNSSNNKWVVSTVINGTEGIKRGTSLALNTFWRGSDSPDVNLYYQSDGSSTTIKSLSYSSSEKISTTSVTPSDNWEPMTAVSGFNSLPGSSLVSYGKQCAFCNQYAYFFWQGQQGINIAENTGDGIKNAELIDIEMEPSVNSSIALTYSGTLEGDGNAILRRSLNLFYRSKTSGLTQLRIGNGMNIPKYVGRDIGPRTNFAAFSTGFNESSSRNPTPIGFQVLSIDPDAGDGVQLTYFKGNDWTTANNEVKDLADCKAKATMTTHTGRRLYCVVDSGDNAGVEIIEWTWKGDPSDTKTYLDWEKVGPVNLDVTSDDTTIIDTMQKVVDAYGKITHCVNTAGYLLEGVIEAAS
ncbi:hypothetical protein NUW58_g8422 [Xylaria curta]|uniref:Uncharacterized protein n=1 Tax=Xylaria curta TaxID=42375 RepID=A0ACC1N9N9_9PEZI|nr:hypothetical protein NUW58_g8422 [Xylaria curta]